METAGDLSSCPISSVGRLPFTGGPFTGGPFTGGPFTG